MNDNFSAQKEKLIAINQEISLLRQQVNYLLRNEKPLGLLDLDVLMNRTHTVYDLLCAIQVGDTAGEEETDFDTDAFLGLFGDQMQKTQEEKEDTYTPEEENEEPAVATELAEVEPLDEPKEQPEGTSQPVEAQTLMSQYEEPIPASDEFGLFFRFEDEPQNEEMEPEPVTEPELAPMPEPEAEQPEESVEQRSEDTFVDEPIVTDEGKVVHFVEEIPEEEIPARDLLDGDSIPRDNPFDMPRMEDGSEEPDFELTSTETLGESLMHEDHSLAARLQQNPVHDLKSVIGINDKFLFVNELFGGSMEKYNKSIENLNDLKTLNGAMIYLNELKIELQWNNSNDAYQKLAELVRRKFE